MELEMKNVGNILYRVYPLCRVCRGGYVYFYYKQHFKNKV